MRQTIGLRAALAFLVLIAIAPVFGVVVQASLADREGRLMRAQAALRSVVDLGAARQESLIDASRQMLSAIALAPPVYGNDLQACIQYMKRLQDHNPVVYGTFGLLDAQGSLTCRAVSPPSAVNSQDRLFFRRAVETGRFSIGEFTVSRASGRPVLTFGMPVYGEDGSALRGVAYLALDLMKADQHLRGLALAPEVTLMVLDGDGVVLASTGPRAERVGGVVGTAFLKQAVDAGQAVFERAGGPDGDDWLYGVQPVGRLSDRKLTVAGLVSSDDVLAASERRLQWQLAALALITLLAATAAWVFGERMLARPVKRMLVRIDAMRREELPLSPAPRALGVLELNELDLRFSEMARALVERAVQRDGALAEMAGQKNLLESVLESMAEGVLVLGRQGRFIHANAAAHRIMPGAMALGMQKDPLKVSVLEWGLFELDGTTPLAPGHNPARRALAGENVDNFQHVIRGRLSGGPEKIIQGNSRILLSPQGETNGAVVVFSDVTEAYRAGQALKDSERRYRTLFESNPHPMWVFDLETLAFLTVNDAAVAHYGYTRDEFLAMTIGDIRPPEDVGSVRASLDREGGMHGPQQWRHRLRDGRQIDVEISSHTLDYGGRPARMVLAHDITERLRAQQALQHMNETLERRVWERTGELAVSNRELESFAYSVSHDLRAPLQVIDGFGKALLTRHTAQLDERARHFLTRIRENTRQMGELIDALLTLARVTRTEIKSERVNLAPTARQIVERLRHLDPTREVAIDIEQDICCSGDARLLASVLENLLENAWKFTARTPGARIQVGSRMEDGAEVIYVADNGAGFDMAYADKLFKAFHRLHSPSEFEGTGIGLATVHRIVTRHGGRVWAKAAPGQGAIFEFTLKVGATDEKQPDTAGRGQPGSSGTHADDLGGQQCPQ